MTVLVTGVTGFVGSAVARALLAEGWTIRALVAPARTRVTSKDSISKSSRAT
jgi:dihydroflavonol-4-reductase